MEVSAFPHCCGMHIIHSYDEVYPRGTKLTVADKEKIEAYLKTQLKSYDNLGMLVTAINSQQIQDGLATVLKKVGFKDLTGEFFNPGHSRYISLFGYEFHKSKRKDTPLEEKKPEPTAPERSEGKPKFAEVTKVPIKPAPVKTLRRLTDAQRERRRLRRLREERGW